MNPTSKKLIYELAIVTIAVLVLARLLLLLNNISWAYNYVPALVAIVLLYGPILVLWKRGRPIDFIERDKNAVRRSVLAFIIAALIVFPVFFVVAHFWQILVFKKNFLGWATFSNIWQLVLYQLIIVALPEEFFFRGYFESTIDRVFLERRKFLGVELGWGWLITAVVFAFAHSVITYQWWHFSIFFPALLFGYLRLRTGNILAPILFHATSNIFMNWFSRMYV
ncbi:MAG: type II CAAX endopeptidase family protein [Pseudomonadota bacterium]